MNRLVRYLNKRKPVTLFITGLTGHTYTLCCYALNAEAVLLLTVRFDSVVLELQMLCYKPWNDLNNENNEIVENIAWKYILHLISP